MLRTNVKVGMSGKNCTDRLRISKHREMYVKLLIIKTWVEFCPCIYKNTYYVPNLQ